MWRNAWRVLRNGFTHAFISSGKKPRKIFLQLQVNCLWISFTARTKSAVPAVEHLTYIEGRGTVGFGQDHVGVTLEFAVETLEQVLEQERNELSRQLQPLIAVVILEHGKHRGMGHGTRATRRDRLLVFTV